MRKVYQSETNAVGIAVSISFGIAFTGVLFGSLPFLHRIAKPERTLELRKTATVELPPPAPEEDLRLPEPEAAAPEAPPEPQLSEAPQAIPLSADLETVEGAGGALAGFGETLRAMTVAEAMTETMGAEELDQRTEPISQVPPTYPPELARAKIGGKVALQVKVGEDGRVADARVASSTRSEFEKPALEAVRKWRFRPPTRNGAPVSSFVVIPIAFNPPKR